MQYTQKLHVFFSCDGYSNQNPMPGHLMQQGKSKSSCLENFFPFVHLKAWTSDAFVPASILTALRILGYVRVLATNTLADFGSMYLYKGNNQVVTPVSHIG